ncbi:MAG: M48 family metalloprotease [Azospirillaceae bacterium]|nr:M48 family metalloprotease [Azospirillaceae bacterium]
MIALTLASIAAPPVAAQSGAPEFIRDAEIEHTIRSYAQPIFEQAGIPTDSVEIALIDSNQINAFVADGMNLFIYTGLLMASDDAGQVVGVIAHETGHIAGGHLVRARGAVEGASAEAILSMVLGVGAAVASHDPGAGVAVMSGGTELARRNLLAFTRTQEGSADAAGMSFLDRAHMSARGMLTFFQKLQGQELLPDSAQSEYVRTHPLTRNRVEAVQQHVAHSKWSDTPLPTEFVEMHRRMKAKLMGFIDPLRALREYPASDPSIAARYARAIAYYRRGELSQALPMVDQLIAAEPRNPFFEELKGQILFENSRVRDAIPPYRRSVALLPDSALLQAALAHALLETNDPTLVDEAIAHLNSAIEHERHSPFMWRLLATGYGRKGDNGMTAYAMSEDALARGDRSAARVLSERAEKLLPAGSPGWLQAQDVRGMAEAPSNDE